MIIVIAFFCILTSASLDLPTEAGGLTSEALINLEKSGAKNPVTAVLLDIRLYDTWLEMLVLLIGAIAVLTLIDGKTNDSPAWDNIALYNLIRLLLPLFIVVAGYLIWLGKFEAGGAFQGGVVLGSAGILFWITGRRYTLYTSQIALRLLITAGTIFICLIGLLAILGGNNLLEHSFRAIDSGLLILGIEVFTALSIAATIALLFSEKKELDERW
jgi:multisubunit Na+/H+ antiporter MnhB subunit